MLDKTTIARIEKGLARKTDKARWRAAIELGEYTKSDPETVWKLCVKWGSARHVDTRMAIATCVLEHILEHHFDPYFNETVKLVRAGNRRLGMTLSSSWKFGQANKGAHSKKFDKFKKWFSSAAA